MRTYNVVPLSHDSGIIEWVGNTVAYRSILMEYYKSMGHFSKVLLGHVSSLNHLIAKRSNA